MFLCRNILVVQGNKNIFPQLLSGNAQILPGTSGPWVEVTIDCGKTISHCLAQRGQWALIRVVPLGREVHPLSIVLTDNGDKQLLSAIISAKAGDWSKRLANLAQSQVCNFKAAVSGPYSTGGGHWSFEHDNGVALLLIAGGTGLNGWLPGLATASESGRPCHLVWCVQHWADIEHLLRDYHHHLIRITVHITRSKARDIDASSESPYTRKIFHSPIAHPELKDTLFFMATPLIATWTALGVLYLWVQHLHQIPSYELTMFSYAFWRRLLPMLSVIGSVWFVWAVACSIFRVARCKTHSYSYLQMLKTASPMQVYDEERRPHDIVLGRPNLVPLVRAATAGLNSQDLAVAACGPTSLVQDAKLAVKTVTGESSSMRI